MNVDLMVAFLEGCNIPFTVERNAKGKWTADIRDYSYKICEDNWEHHSCGIGMNKEEAIEDFAKFLSGKTIKNGAKVWTVPFL